MKQPAFECWTKGVVSLYVSPLQNYIWFENIGNSLKELMTACQYYYSAFDGLNRQQLFNV